MVEKRLNKRLKIGVVSTELTKTEREVLKLYTDEYLTPKQISYRRHTTDKAVYKILKKLEKKGIFDIGLEKVEKRGGSFQPFINYRIHSEQYKIRILWSDHKYKKALEKCNKLTIDGNTIKLWDKIIEIYSNTSFIARTLEQAIFKSIQYWDHFINRLEHELKIILKKPRSQNIKLVKAHYSETNNELAKDIDNRGDRYLKVYTKEDGKLWLLIDNSFNLHEIEAVHSKTGKQDIEKVRDLFNDVRYNEFYLPSNTKTLIDNLYKFNYDIRDNIKEMAYNMKTHTKVMKDILKLTKNLNKFLKNKKLYK